MSEDKKVFTDEIKAEDYKEPICLFNKDFYSNCKVVKSIPVERVIDKLDECLGHNDYEGAWRILDYWVNEAVAGNDLKGELSIQNEVMGLARKTEKEAKAFDAAKRALELLEIMELEDRIIAGTTYVNVATVYKAFGQAEEALPLYQKAKVIYEKELKNDDCRLGGLYNNMALALCDVRNFDEAETYFNRALEVMKNVKGGELEIAITYLNMANMAEMKFGMETAENIISMYLKDAMELLNREDIDRNGYYAFVCEKCAPSYEYYGYFAYGQELERRAKEIYERA